MTMINKSNKNNNNPLLNEKKISDTSLNPFPFSMDQPSTPVLPTLKWNAVLYNDLC